MRPRLLDAYCCQGAASKGYTDVGLVTDGVDIDHQSRYPYAFYKADAIEFIKEHGHEYAAIHTSPPCQHDSDCQRIQGNDHPDLIGPTRDALIAAGKPYVIENVDSRSTRAKLVNPIMLCGTMFGLRTYRHRLFEANFPLVAPPHPEHIQPTIKMGRPVQPGDFYHAVGNFSGVAYIREDMGVPWMNRDGIRECIPPVYTEFIGRQLVDHLQEMAA
jgi:DNA (cytosine-5)-methyltransferase 1